MGLVLGIVGLPNVGKSTLFRALTRVEAEAANYPFCTIEPNVGIVPVQDERLQKLNELIKPEKCVPATLKVVDIAGLVKGASEGEGLGNQFLSHIREVQAIAHVVRCFDVVCEMYFGEYRDCTILSGCTAVPVAASRGIYCSLPRSRVD